MGSQNSVSSKNQLAPEKQEHEINFINSDNSNQSIEQEDHYHAKFDDFSTDNHPKSIIIYFKNQN